MTDKYIAKEQLGKYKPGEEVKESSAVCNVLVLLGKAEKVTDAAEAPPQVSPAVRRRGRPPRQPEGAVGAVTTEDFKKDPTE